MRKNAVAMTDVKNLGDQEDEIVIRIKKDVDLGPSKSGKTTNSSKH